MRHVGEGLGLRLVFQHRFYIGVAGEGPAELGPDVNARDRGCADDRRTGLR
jgi:hypothetical protein